MDQPIACIILRGTIYDWYIIPILLAIAVVPAVARNWRFFLQWLYGIRGRDWAVVPAVVDVVSVVPQTEQDRGGERIVGYLATLTFFYRNSELQMGEYSRMFDEEQHAQLWAASYKGNTVMVHVNPRDQSRSVLREEEL
jgi:hypothetical protein